VKIENVSTSILKVELNTSFSQSFRAAVSAVMALLSRSVLLLCMLFSVFYCDDFWLDENELVLMLR